MSRQKGDEDVPSQRSNGGLSSQRNNGGLLSQNVYEVNLFLTILLIVAGNSVGLLVYHVVNLRPNAQVFRDLVTSVILVGLLVFLQRFVFKMPLRFID